MLIMGQESIELPGSGLIMVSIITVYNCMCLMWVLGGCCMIEEEGDIVIMIEAQPKRPKIKCCRTCKQMI